MIRLTLPVRPKPWSTNEDRNLHPHARHKRVAEWKDAAIVAYKQAKRAGLKPDGKVIVTVHIPFDQNRRRDPSNYCGTVMKAVIDGLVVAGMCPDDTPEWVGHREPVLVVDKKAMPVVVLDVDVDG